MKILPIDNHINYLEKRAEECLDDAKDFYNTLIGFLNRASFIEIPDEVVERYKNDRNKI